MSTSTPLAVITHAIPGEMKEYAQFVSWKETMRGGKPTKVPINPDMGSFAQVDCPSTWSRFDVAIARYRKDRLAGIGFVFHPIDPYTGIDFDKCRNPETGEIDAEVRAMVGLLDSYSEVSPSGTGVKLIVRGTLPGTRNRVARIEMYDTLRFFTLTGHRLPDTPAGVNERQPQLDQLYRRLFGEPEAIVATGVSASAATQPGDALWEWAYPRLSARMKRVANMDDADYGGDASRADAALIAAFIGMGLVRSEVAAAFRASPRAPSLAARKGENRLDYLIERATAHAAAFVGEGKIL